MDAKAKGRRGPAGGWRAARWRPLAWVVVALLAGSGAGCRGAGETTDTMVPPWWRGNPWGPEANQARSVGTIASVPNNPDMAAWEDWGRRNLKDGDVLLRMGDARAVFGLFPFSKVSAAIAGSRYSHSGIVAIENGEPVVYDTTTTGPQRQPFPIWVLDTRGSLAVKRPRAEYQAYAPGAVAYCRAVYHRQVPFDFDMRLGDDRFYCIELTERSYREAGLVLSQPVQLDRLPGYDAHPWIVRLLRVCTSMEPSQKAFVIGNANVGIWSSPALETIYEAPHARPPGMNPVLTVSPTPQVTSRPLPPGQAGER